MIQSLRCFLGQNSLPLGGPWAMSSDSKQLIILKTQSRKWCCLWGFFDWINYSNKTQKTSLEARRGSPNLSSNRRPSSLECGCMKLGLGREKVCHEYFVRREQSGVWRGWEARPRTWALGHSDCTLIPALRASHCLPPLTQLKCESWRVWSHDLDLGRWPTRAQGPASHWNQGEEEVSSCRKGWGRVMSTAVGGAWGRPGAVSGLPAPVRTESPSWGWGRCWAQGLRAPVPGVDPELLLRPEGNRLLESPLLLVCQLVWTSLGFLSRGLSGYLQMQLCGFWLASGKKCRITLGDANLIWIQVLSLRTRY